MTLARRPGTAAAVLVTAAAVLLGGCSSGHHGTSAAASASAGSTAGSSGASSGGTSGGASAGTASGGASDPAEAPGSAADAPKVPDAQLTPPGGGTFTKPQKKYLSGRVPKGTDPVAVLEGGQETCERLVRTSAIDPDDSASAIVSGDISASGAAAAVTALCPNQQPVLAEAARGFTDGSFAVSAHPVTGKSIGPGTYHSPHPSATCTWRVGGPKGATLASGSAASAAKATFTVPAGATTVTSSGCYAWLPPGPAPIPSPTASGGTP